MHIATKILIPTAFKAEYFIIACSHFAVFVCIAYNAVIFNTLLLITLKTETLENFAPDKKIRKYTYCVLTWIKNSPCDAH